MEKEQSCKMSRWQLLKSELNNLAPKAFHKEVERTKDSIILDCRTRTEFEKSHIEGAINIDFMADNFWDQVILLPKTTSIYVYCQIGRKSIRACTLMRNGGFNNQNLFNLDGGYKEWNEEMQISK